MNDPARRLSSLGLITAMLFSALYVRVALLTTVESGAQRRQGERFLRAENSLPATRGRILARDGRILVDNLAVNIVKFDDKGITRAKRTAVISRLASLLAVPYSTIEGRLVDPRKPRFEAARIATNVKESVVIYLAEKAELFPGVTTDVTWQRVYPYGAFAAHTLGYLGRVNADDIRREPADRQYQTTDYIGRSGVEESFEAELRGVPGKEIITKDPSGNVVERKAVREPVAGKDVRLTIEIPFQELAESTLRQGLPAARRNPWPKYNSKGVITQVDPIKATAGALVCMDVNNGEVVASASYPTFDPTEFNDGLSFKRAEELQADGQFAPLLNRVTQGQYPPGSTFKLITALAALRYGIITTESTYVDRGVFEIPDQKLLADLKKRKVKFRWKNAGFPPSRFGTINLRSAIRVSSDAFFYRIGYEFHLNSDTENGIQRVARELGLGKYTNIRLAPRERIGVVPDRERQERLHTKYPTKFRKDWPLGATINVSIGQGDVLVTPLQLVRAYSALANGGTVLDAKIELAVQDRAILDNLINGIAPTGTNPASNNPALNRSATDPDAFVGLSGASGTQASIGDSTVASTTTSTTTIAAAGVAKDATFGAASSPVATETTLPTPTETIPDSRYLLGVKVPVTPTLPPVDTPPAVEGHIDIPDDARKTIIAGLQDVVGRKGGTAVGSFSGFDLRSYPVAGKTGTAEKKGEQDYSVFVGFGPVQAPKYACAAVIEEGGFGRQAGALVRRMFEGISGASIGPVRTVGGTEGGAER